MKTVLCVLLVACVPAPAWNPAQTARSIFGGKVGLSVSLCAFGVAESADYKTTVQAIDSGAAREINPLLINSRGQFVQGRFIGYKVASFAAPAAVEAVMYRKMNDTQRTRYGKWMALANWGAAAAVGVVALHNHQIYETVR